MRSIAVAGVERKYRGSRGVYFAQTEDLAVLRGLSSNGKYALDLGTGTGRFAFVVAERCGFAVGVDIEIDGLRTGKSQAQPGARLAFVAMDGAALGFRNDSLDLVTAIGTFEFTHDLRPVLREICRVLTPEGDLVFTCWNRARWPKLELLDRRGRGSVLWSAAHVQAQTEQCGLRVESVESIFFLPRRLLWWSHRLLLIEPLRRLLVVGSIALETNVARKRSWGMAGRVLVVRARKAGSPSSLVSLKKMEQRVRT